ncbi:hypothetical protein BJ508DRAFT_76568 [Ascobolus immersus RN42]|uniref:Uncharacterized protein n=1 Tax=Ascobolus immersus RN42 TaxID=1160509 RepID=A0A3N4HDB1_ASCIM|nr:hypothetical protein BJ508DRAFT_76568 [Ascobolus immersus RN42]
MKYTLLTTFLPLALAASVPSRPTTLHKRGVNYRNNILSRSKYRPASGWAEPLDIDCDILVPRAKHFLWPREGPRHPVWPDADRHLIEICTVQNQLDEFCDPENKSGELMDQSVNDCPDDLPELVARIVENSKKAGWEPVIDEGEAVRELKVIMPEAFEGVEVVFVGKKSACKPEEKSEDEPSVYPKPVPIPIE